MLGLQWSQPSLEVAHETIDIPSPLADARRAPGWARLSSVATAGTIRYGQWQPGNLRAPPAQGASDATRRTSTGTYTLVAAMDFQLVIAGDYDVIH